MHASRLDACVRGGAVISTGSRPWNSVFDSVQIPGTLNLQNKITSERDPTATPYELFFFDANEISERCLGIGKMCWRRF